MEEKIGKTADIRYQLTRIMILVNDPMRDGCKHSSVTDVNGN